VFRPDLHLFYLLVYLNTMGMPSLKKIRNTLLHFHCNNIHANKPQCYMICTMLICFFLLPGISNWPGKVSMHFCEHRDNWCSCCCKSSLLTTYISTMFMYSNWHWWTLCSPVIYLMHIDIINFHKNCTVHLDNLTCNSLVTVCVVFLWPQQSFKHNLQIPTECVLYLQTFSHLSPISSISFL